MPTLVHQDIPRQDWMTDNIYDWAQAEESARCNTQLRLTLGYDHALIAIKAQHPLSANGTPNGEYTARLREALKIKSELESHGTTVTLMTFGGIHAGCTTISLAEAGATWLITHGVHPDHIITQPAVYSGTDEDDLAAQEFASHPRYRELHVILSAGQWERTRLYFIATGWQPYLHPVIYLEDRPHHSTVCEIWGTWPGSIHDFKEQGLSHLLDAAMAIRQRHRDELATFRIQSRHSK